MICNETNGRVCSDPGFLSYFRFDTGVTIFDKKIVTKQHKVLIFEKPYNELLVGLEEYRWRTCSNMMVDIDQ